MATELIKMESLLLQIQDTARISIGDFKKSLFLQEVIITAIDTTAAYFVLKAWRKKKDETDLKNKKYKNTLK